MYSRQLTPLLKSVKTFIVKEELGDELPRPRIHFLFQILYIFHEAA